MGGTGSQPPGQWAGDQPWTGSASGIGSLLGLVGLAPNTPQAPNITGAASQQVQANRPDINTPFAQQGWQQGPDGQWTMNSGFAGPMAGAANAWGQQALDAANMPLMGGQDAINQAIDSSYGQATSRLDPMWNQREEAMRTQLLNQGLDPTSEAYRTSMGDLGRQRNDAYTSAMNAAIGAGGQRGESLFGMNAAARSMPLQQSLLMSQLLRTPDFNRASEYLPGAIAQGQANNERFDRQSQGEADAFGGIGDLLKSLMGLGG